MKITFIMILISLGMTITAAYSQSVTYYANGVKEVNHRAGDLIVQDGEVRKGTWNYSGPADTISGCVVSTKDDHIPSAGKVLVQFQADITAGATASDLASVLEWPLFKVSVTWVTDSEGEPMFRSFIFRIKDLEDVIPIFFLDDGLTVFDASTIGMDSFSMREFEIPEGASKLKVALCSFFPDINIKVKSIAVTTKPYLVD